MLAVAQVHIGPQETAARLVTLQACLLASYRQELDEAVETAEVHVWQVAVTEGSGSMVV